QYVLVREKVFPFIKNLHGNEDSAYARHMKDAMFSIESPRLLSAAIEQIDALPLQDKDAKGDLYEYMLSKLSTAGTNGQFRTPRHIIKTMVELVAPTETDTVCDPACGTAGFLVGVAEYLQRQYPEMLLDKRKRTHFSEKMFSGFDFDSTMLRIGSMNLLLHGIEHPHIEARDSLSQDHAGVEEQF